MTSRIEVRAAMFAALCAVLPSAASAGSDNQIYVLQESSTGGGNTLFVDQSLANDSLVRGLGTSGLAPATQKGDDNSAELKITGSGGEIRLQQTNPAVGQPGNDAEVEVQGDALATVSQIGSDNFATLNVSGTLAEGSILQNGSGNDALLTVSGTNANGTITQNGDDNETALVVTGAGTSVDYTLTGDGVATFDNGGVQVFTNGAIVTITQTAVVPISR